MRNMKKTGIASALVLTLASITLVNSATAGTGGKDHAGILYGEDNAYCDAQGVTLIKKDSLTGLELNGAEFTVSNPTSNPIGVKAYSSTVTSGQISSDRILWQNAFNTALDDEFSATTLGGLWKTASVQTDENRKASVNSDDDSTTYTPSGEIISPADITELPATTQSTAMAAWAQQAGVAGTTSSVAEYFAASKERLDALGAVAFSDYDANDPQPSHTVRAALAGSDSEVAVLDEYGKAYAHFSNILAAVAAAGYPDVTFTGTTLNVGTLDQAEQNWTDFVEAYDAMTTEGAFAFGIAAPTYDVIYDTVGTSGVNVAFTAGNAAVGATALGADQVHTTDSDGEVNLGLFGRTLTEASFGDSTSTMDRTCGHLTVNVQETKAPAGYAIDDESVRDVVASSVENAIVNEEWTDTLIQNGTVDTPNNKPFESGM